MTSIKNVADVTFFDKLTGEELVYNSDTKELEGTGRVVYETENELVYSTADEDDYEYDWYDDYACENGCCRCCGCSCYDYYEDDDDIEVEVDEDEE